MGKYNRNDTAYFAGGCFWCLEAVFMRTKGVASCVSGYAGGERVEPTYEEVNKGKTGHAETVKLEYDKTQISYDDLLAIYFFVHDPTDLNRQGKGVRTQYRSVIFYDNEEQKAAAEKFIAKLNAEGAFPKPVMTEVKPLKKFYLADEAQQEYFDHNLSDPYCAFVIVPKLEKFEKKFKEFFKA
jgi:peptide-methionine (S)-S-oxide reductase